MNFYKKSKNYNHSEKILSDIKCFNDEFITIFQERTKDSFSKLFDILTPFICYCEWF